MTPSPAPVDFAPGNLTAPQAVAADTLEHGIGRFLEVARPAYVAIPFLLTTRMGAAYPLGPLAVDPRLCCAGALAGVTGYGWRRDDEAGVDWYCTLEPDHAPPCGYELDAAVVLDAIDAGYFAELTPIDEDLDDDITASILERLTE